MNTTVFMGVTIHEKGKNGIFFRLVVKFHGHLMFNNFFGTPKTFNLMNQLINLSIKSKKIGV